MSVLPARIVLDLHEAPEKAWCWRDDWATGWDSIYGLLSKFAKLNSIDAATLACNFLRGDTGRKTAIVKNPEIDLRGSDFLDCQVIASTMRLDLDAIGRAFTANVFPNGQRKIATFLRWCPECLNSGFHAAVHQIDFLSSCPLHGKRMLTKCPKCHSTQPYLLSRPAFDKPFSCCKCGYIFAGFVYKPATKSLLLETRQEVRLTDITNLARYADEVLILAFEVDRASWRRGHGRFAIAKADFSRDHSQYAGFVTSVLDRLQYDRQQFTLPLDKVATVGRGLPVLIPKQKGRAGRGRIKKGIRVQWEPSLSRYYTLYLAIRRHLWRHALKRHQKCCRSASEKIWWSVVGSETQKFCVLAEAFLKWRMYWEGCASPSDLWRPLSSAPRGIVNWIDESAPIFHYGWSEGGDEWVAGHCFVLKCLSTFRDLLSSFSTSNRDVILWERPQFSGEFERYWAVCGNDSDIFPLILFMQIRSEISLAAISGVYKSSLEHYSWHLKQISAISH